MAAEHIRHWKIGDVEVARIVEVNAHEDPIAVLLPDAGPELVKQHDWLIPRFATPDGRMRISFQAFVVKTPARRLMVDTCIGNDRQREFEIFCNMQTSFLEDLTAAGCPADTIDTVLCTHLHFDHVGWNTRLVNGRWVPTFPKARYLFGRREYEHWQMLKRTGGYHSFDHIVDSIEPIVEAGLADYVEPNHRVTDEIWLEPTPGHTPGHVSVRISSKGHDAVITGDMMHHPIQLAEPDRFGNFDMDKELAARTRRDFITRYENRKALVIGSHFCDPTAGYIVRDKRNWRFSDK
jgi:glyoxylase-like metal-dependent hydrolase (beta-lactamase superfamily II)